MSNYQILYIIFRAVEIAEDEQRPQFQVYCKSEEGLEMKEYLPGKIAKFKVLGKSELYFKFFIHRPFSVTEIVTTMTVQELNLTAFEPKTCSLKLVDENNKSYYAIFDALSYQVQNEQDDENPMMLFDFKIQKISGTETLVPKVEEALKKKTVGFVMIEYQMSFQYLQQLFTIKFSSTGQKQSYKKNTFITSKQDISIIKLQLIVSCFEWFIEGQEKTLVESKTLSETTLDVKDFLDGTLQTSRKSIYADVELMYSVEFRASQFLQNFIGYLDFRIITAQFDSEAINKPRFIAKQLGSDVSWEMTPYARFGDDEYLMDYHYYKEGKALMEKRNAANQEFGSTPEPNYRKALNLKAKDRLTNLKLEVDENTKFHLDFLYEMEKIESENKSVEFNFIHRKNKGFFMLTSPNETILVEVYQETALIGYFFLPMANVNFGQNYLEEIKSLLPDTGLSVLGDVVVRLEFHPASIKSDPKILGNIGSLDFDDISQKFKSSSDLFEVSLLMEKNILESKQMIWPSQIKNSFKSNKKARKFILNVSEIYNLIEIYSKDINFNSMAIKVRMNNIQQRLDIVYNELTVEEMKRKQPKTYFLLCTDFYRQVRVEDKGDVKLFFKISENLFGMMTIQKIDESHHFEFMAFHPKETVIISLYLNNKVLDYHMIPLEGLPINQDIDSFCLPFKFPSPNRKNLEKKSIFIKFDTIMYSDEPEKIKEYPSGLFLVQRMRSKDKSILGKSNTGSIYDIEIEIPGKKKSKTINLSEDAVVDRTYFEHLIEVQKQENLEIKLTIYKPEEDSEFDQNDKKAVTLYQTKLKLSIGEDNSNFSNISLTNGCSADRRIEFKDGSGYVGFDLAIFYKSTKFIEFPEGTLKVRLNDQTVNAMRQSSALRDVYMLKIYVADDFDHPPSMIYFDRSMNDPSNQALVYTKDPTNKLVFEAYDTLEKILSRTIINIYDLALVESEEFYPVVINETKISMIFGYTSLIGEDDGEEGGKSVKGEKGLNVSVKNKNAGQPSIKDQIALRIKEVENENLIMRTNYNKIKGSYEKKLKLIEQLKKHQFNTEEKNKEEAVLRKNFKPLANTSVGLAMTGMNKSNSSSQTNRLKELYKGVCQCGKPNPQFKGFCGNCLKELKEKYEAAMKDYQPIAQEYDALVLKKHNFIKKSAAIEKKIKNYEERMKQYKFDFINEEEENLKDELKELKAKVLEKKTETSLLVSEHNFMVENLKEQQLRLEKMLDKQVKKLDALQSIIDKI